MSEEQPPPAGSPSALPELVFRIDQYCQSSDAHGFSVEGRRFASMTVTDLAGPSGRSIEATHVLLSTSPLRPHVLFVSLLDLGPLLRDPASPLPAGTYSGAVVANGETAALLTVELAPVDCP